MANNSDSPIFLELFDEPVLAEKVFCQQISPAQYEEESEKETYKALQLLIQYMECCPNKLYTVFRKRKLEDMENEGLIPYFKNKLYEGVVGKEKLLESVMTNEECRSEMLKMKGGIQSAFNYSQEAKEQDGESVLHRSLSVYKSARFDQLHKSRSTFGRSLNSGKLARRPLRDVGNSRRVKVEEQPKGLVRRSSSLLARIFAKAYPKKALNENPATPVPEEKPDIGLSTPFKSLCYPNINCSMETSLLALMDDKMAGQKEGSTSSSPPQLPRLAASKDSTNEEVPWQTQAAATSTPMHVGPASSGHVVLDEHDARDVSDDMSDVNDVLSEYASSSDDFEDPIINDDDDEDDVGEATDEDFVEEHPRKKLKLNEDLPQDAGVDEKLKPNESGVDKKLKCDESGVDKKLKPNESGVDTKLNRRENASSPQPTTPEDVKDRSNIIHDDEENASSLASTFV